MGPPAGTRILRGLAVLLIGAYFAAGLAYLALRYLVWPNPDWWLPHARQVLAEAIGQPVHIGALRTGFDGLRPSVEIDRVSLIGPDGAPALGFERAYATISLSSLLLGKLRMASLEVSAPGLRVERATDGRFSVAGFDLPASEGLPGAFDAGATGAGVTDGSSADHRGLAWLFAQRRIVLHGVTIDWADRQAGQTLRLQGADLELGSIGRRHRLSLRLPEVPELAGRVALAVELRRPAFGSMRKLLDDWRGWSGSLYLAAESVDLPALARLVPARHWSPALQADAIRGQAGLRLWVDFDDGQLADALLKLAAVDTVPGVTGLRFDSVDAEASLHRMHDDGYQLRLQRLSLVDDEGLRLSLAGTARQWLDFGRNGRLAGGELALERFDAGRLLGLARSLPLPADLAAALAPLQARGSVEHLTASWRMADGDRDDLDEHHQPTLAGYTVAARVEGLSLARAGPAPEPGRLGLPAFENLSGTLDFNEAGGRLAAAGRKVVLIFPGLFAEPVVPLEAVDARLSWQHRPRRTIVEIEHLRFSNADAAGELAGHYATGGKGLGEVDLSGRLTRARATRVYRYLPLVIAEPVRDWVRDAIRAGTSGDVRFVLRGDLLDFPFSQPDSGLFRVEAALADGTLAYAPDWPVIEKIGARLVFEGNGMDIDARSGRLWGVTLGRTRAVIPQYHDARLRIEGRGAGPAQDMLRFVRESPLRTVAGDFVAGIAVDGAADLDLKLDLPLDRIADTRVTGAVRLAGNPVRLTRSLPVFEDVAGRLEFTEASLRLHEFTGRFAGGPIRVEGETQGSGRLRLRGSGQASADGIRQLANDPLTATLTGTADWQARIEAAGAALSMTIDSELAGLAVKLPAPFDKPAAERWPLRIEVQPLPDTADGAPARDRVTAVLKDELRLLMEREHDAAGGPVRIRRGILAMAAGAQLPESGFALRLRAPEVDLDAWSAVLRPALAAQETAPAAGAALSLLPTEVSVQTDVLIVAGKALNQVNLAATRSGDLWRADVQAREIDGSFSWHDALPGESIGTLNARFKRLEIPAGRGDDVASLIDAAPRRMPALDIAADAFVLNGRPLGRLVLRAVNAGTDAAPIWRVETLTLDHPAARLAASGRWRVPHDGQRRGMALDFELAIGDAGRLLEVFGYPGTMRSGAGSLRGHIAWNGSPFAIDYPSLTGELGLALGKGEFLKTEPGIAKLIGVLNLQSLRRRLSFDFRDLFSEGFAFDEITGSARIAQGIAATDDFTMRGVTAQVRLSGTAGLAAETQDLLVEVRPELNAGLASLAYAALANPAIGLGTFLAQWLLREPLREIFAWQYQVTGTWAEPQVEIRSRPTLEAPPVGG